MTLVNKILSPVNDQYKPPMVYEKHIKLTSFHRTQKMYRTKIDELEEGIQFVFVSTDFNFIYWNFE